MLPFHDKNSSSFALITSGAFAIVMHGWSVAMPVVGLVLITWGSVLQSPRAMRFIKSIHVKPDYFATWFSRK